MPRVHNRFGNFEGLQQALLAKAKRIEQEKEKGAHAIGKMLTEECLRILDKKIYKAIIPKRTWILTSDLRDHQRYEVQGDKTFLKNDCKHAGPRERLGTPSGLAIRTPGVQSTQWQHEAIENKMDEIAAIRKKHIRRAMTGK